MGLVNVLTRVLIVMVKYGNKGKWEGILKCESEQVEQLESEDDEW